MAYQTLLSFWDKESGFVRVFESVGSDTFELRDSKGLVRICCMSHHDIITWQLFVKDETWGEDAADPQDLDVDGALLQAHAVLDTDVSVAEKTREALGAPPEKKTLKLRSS